MKTHRIRFGRKARTRRCRSTRGTAALFQRHSSFEGLELRTVLSGGSLLSASALQASESDDAHTTPINSLSVAHLLASNLASPNSSDSPAASTADEPAAAPLAATINENPGDDDAPPVNALVEGISIDVFLRAEDLGGEEITSTEIGEDFRLLVFVDDVRSSTPITGPMGENLFGVFGAYVRATYDTNLISLVPGTLSVAEFFDDLEVKTDTSTPGEIRAGGITLQIDETPGSDPQLLWSVTLHAGGGGTTSFGTFFETFSDGAFPAEWLTFGDNDVLTADNVVFNTLALTITGPEISINDVTRQETDENQEFVFTVSLSEPSSQEVTVAYTTNDGTASAPDDYVAKSGTVTFAANETEQLITITVVGDNDQEGDETFTVNLSDPVAAGLADNTGLGTIENDDATEIGISSASQPEEDEENTMVFTVTISSASTSAVIVPFTTEDGSATAGDDYQATSGTLTFAAGSTEAQLITVVINGDTDPEANEDFGIVLTEPANASFELDGMATGTLVNDDGPHISFVENQVSQLEDVTEFVFTVTIGEAGDEPVTVAFTTMDGTALADSDYTANSGTLAFTGETITQDITVTVNNDQLHEADESFSLILSAPENATLAETTATGIIENDDSLPTLEVESVSEIEGVEIVFAVNLSNPSGQEVTVQYVTVDGTAIAGSDYEGVADPVTLTFLPGETQKLVTVLVFTDALPEADETFQLRLFDATNVSNTEDLFATGTIENDDQLTLSIEGPLPQNEGDEGSTPFVFTITLSAASEDEVTVKIDTRDGTATVVDADFDVISGTVTFEPGVTTRFVTVLVQGDTRQEGDEDFSVILLQPSGATIENGSATAVIVDDEGPPTVSISDVSQAEGDSGTTSFVFTVSLSGASANLVSVNFATFDDTATLSNNDYITADGTLNFAAGVTSRIVTVNVVGDTFFEGIERFSVQLSNPDGATIDDGTGIGTIESEATDDISNLPSSISGKVFFDSNGDGTHTDNERPFPGLQVFLTGPTNIETTTGPDGSYFFNNLVPGLYTVNFTQPLEYVEGIVHVGSQGGEVLASGGGFTFTIESLGGIVGSENNFTSRGLLGQFISQRLFLASELGAATTPPAQEVTVAISTVTDPIISANAISTTISGTGTAGVTISVVASDGNSSTGAMLTTVDGDGNWSIGGINVSALADGTITYTVGATGTGNSTAEASTTATKDTVGPLVTIGSVTDPVNASNADDTSISGTSEAGAIISVDVSDGVNSTTDQTTADENGNWSIGGIDVGALADGTITYTVTATDEFGNSGSNSMEVVKDTESPTVAVTMVVPDPINADNQSAVTINGTGEAGASISVNVSDDSDSTGPFTATVDENSNWTISGINVSGLDDGTLTFTVIATDSATNTTTITETAEKDTVTEVTPDDVDPINSENQAAVAVSGIGEAGAIVSIVATDGANTTDPVETTILEDGTWATTIDVTSLNDGEITFTVTATDLAGNTDEKTDTADKDTVTAVDITELIDPIGIGDDESVAVDGTGEVDAMISVVVTDGVNSTDAVMTTVDQDGNWSLNVDVSGLDDGTLTFTATITDLANNTSEHVDAAEKSTLAIASVTDPINAEDADMVMISGTGEVGATVSVVAGDGENATDAVETTIDENGNWSVNVDVSSLDDGMITFTVNATDDEDNMIEKTITADKDTVTEVTPDDVDPINSENQAAVAVSGIGEAGAIVSIVATDGANTTDPVETTILEDGTWATTIDVTSLNDGEITFTVTATDLAGNTDEKTDTADKDTVTAVDITELIDPIGIGDDESVAVDGTGEVDAMISVVVTDGVNSTDAVMTTVDQDGNWSLNVDVSGLDDGTLTFTATITDLANNTSEHVDAAEKSTLAIASVTDPINAEDADMVMISGTGEVGATVSVVAGDGENATDAVETTIDENGNWSVNVDVSSLDDGMITFTANATDDEDNMIEKTITADKDTVTEVTPDDVDPINSENQAAVAVSGIGEAGAIVSIVATDGANTTDPVETTILEDGTWATTIDVTSLNDGEITFTVTATDLAGNTDEKTDTADKDTVTVVEITELIDPIGIGDDESVAVGGTGEADATIEVVVTDADDNPTGTFSTTVDQDGNWSLNVDVSGLDDGTLTFTVTATDLANNTAQHVTTAEKDTLAIASVTDPINAEDADMVMISGTGEVGATVSVVAGDGENATDAAETTIDENGNWSVNVDVSSLDDGTITFTVNATDDEDNAIEKTITAEKDTVAPVVEIGDVTDPISPEDADNTSISGTGENGAMISVVASDHHADSTIAFMVTVADGIWSIDGIDVSALLSDHGEITYTVTATDMAGNTYTTEVNVMVERVASAASFAMMGGEDEDDDEELTAVAMALSASSDDPDSIDEALAAEGDWLLSEVV